MSESSVRRPLRLEKVTEENVAEACRIQVAPEQEAFVTPVAESLAEAYVHQDLAWPRVVMDGDETVGFVMAFFDVRFTEDGSIHDRPRSGLWRLNIAAGKQGRGYGRFAVEAVMEELRRRGGTRVTVTWRQGENGPEEFYRKLGFALTGETSGPDVVGERDLPPSA
ncbi:GNAT family N-acetyltransferase [Streptomyces sp. MUM 203J]|uniref:GNAT family N-acetyltransferase n=1 Tax=Streptomyces sp. MUM 203J TaxID=2791990 RepID=UPI001F0355DB|nr:GNAT family N-acetyltransferase [Streptomyces sp. MUM 203J]MCH0540285.1 GNAT family N-acetyltransferase [Streptomyces sp. MUM 203J]